MDTQSIAAQLHALADELAGAPLAPTNPHTLGPGLLPQASAGINDGGKFSRDYWEREVPGAEKGCSLQQWSGWATTQLIENAGYHQPIHLNVMRADGSVVSAAAMGWTNDRFPSTSTSQPQANIGAADVTADGDALWRRIALLPDVEQFKAVANYAGGLMPGDRQALENAITFYKFGGNPNNYAQWAQQMNTQPGAAVAFDWTKV